MILKIRDTRRVSELQDKFSECFPHLKIEFFDGVHKLKQNESSHPKTFIADLSKKHEQGEILIKSSYRAEQVVHEFKERFGLLVQLYRIKGNYYVLLEEHELLNGDSVQIDNDTEPAQSL